MNFIRQNIFLRLLLVALALQILSCSIRIPVAFCYAVQAGISNDNSVSVVEMLFDILLLSIDKDNDSYESGNEECAYSDEIEQKILLFYQKVLHVEPYFPSDLLVKQPFPHVILYYSEFYSKITPPPPKL